MQDAIVLKNLGTPKQIAADLSEISDRAVADKTVTAWRIRDRIPGEWRPWVARLAAAKIPGFSTEQFLLAAKTRTYTRRSAA